MCGIVGYIGNKDSLSVLLEGLRRLEYRGYDSSGVALLEKGNIRIVKTPGKIKDLDSLLRKEKISQSVIGIAHTRWATHGAPTKLNAHPHTDCRNNFSIVHNGIIENFASLKKELVKQGHKFISETDTEVVAHLIEKYYKGDLKKAFLQALARLKGSFAIVLLSKKHPDRLLFARQGSPLIVGVGKNENFLASDVPAILSHTNRVIYVKDAQAGEIRKNKVSLFDIKGRPQPVKIEKVLWDLESAQKSGYAHFMLKEIHEQPQVLKHLSCAGIKFDKKLISILKNTKQIFIVACGTAYHSGMVGKYAIEEMTKIPVAVDLSSEFRYRSPIIDNQSVLIAISQSGETADTLAAVREAKNKDAKIISICNAVGSSLVRESDFVLYTHAGPEIGVASTKAYTAQLMVLYLLALNIAKVKKTLPKSVISRYANILCDTHNQARTILKNSTRHISEIAGRHHNFGSFLFLGRNVNYPSALEGALKLKEISYIPAEGYAAGEMKHGPIALIDEYRAVVCIATESKIYEKMISNIQEIEARKGKIVIIATYGNADIKRHSKEVIFIPKVEELFSPILVALPLQLFAYYVAAKRGCDIDQPRNLAKSVTVE
ncbi:MAG: glutamine--fructose-6-phosphate transaminase (isomerizing) [Candidatus Omnitrophica bacterium]|nr:glutamine--fructose-6-phosphate transaminase (isomerizing) [Candidatus Omnitrophota bacterium]MDD5351620.1 glutamine--fructose-6-phosphate transaminase (isomerizing) [Candidatus Omnitrophota bacterium]MDD5550830.1 glutamine--fructose-6-phosphate transaminase (isomerizing) [Candidatus Omnitrophota bacterium]